jgi:hypothetical protein
MQDSLEITSLFSQLPLQNNNIEYEAYLGLICEALTPLGKGIPHINEKWTKSVIHGVPTRAKIPTIQTDQLTIYLHFSKPQDG